MTARSYRDVFAAWRRWAAPFVWTIVIMVVLSPRLIATYHWRDHGWGVVGAIAAAVTCMVVYVAIGRSARKTKMWLLCGLGTATIALVLSCLRLRAFLEANAALEAAQDEMLNRWWVFLYAATFCGCAAALTTLSLLFTKDSSEPHITILFLAASPSDQDRHRFGEESREVEAAIRRSNYRDQFRIVTRLAIREPDLAEYLQQYSPQIVHFSGHGSPSGELVLQNNRGKSHPVSAEALRHIFAALNEGIRLVVLNTCYSEIQAAAIVESVDCVIGSTGRIKDPLAIAFATAFYGSLGYGKSVSDALDLSKNNLRGQMQILDPRKKAESLVFATLDDQARVAATTTTLA